MTHRDLSVDPDGVIRTGSAYTASSEIVRAYLRQLDQLRSTYYNSWGDDSLGQQFSQKFLEGMDTLDRLVTGLGDALDFGGQGLRAGGKAYLHAEEDATEGGRRLYKALLPLDQQPHYRAAVRVDGLDGQVPEQQLEPGAPTGRLRRRAVTAASPLRMVRSSERARPERLLSRLTDPAEPPQIGLRSRRNPQTGQEEQLTTIDGQEFLLRPVDRPEGDELITPLGVLTSSTVSRLDWAGATVDGYPLADGHMLMEANELPGGHVRLDTGLYESIVPLTGEHTALTAHGEPIQPDGGSQLFIVKRAPDYAGTPAGELRNYAEFQPDGTAYPYISELETPGTPRLPQVTPPPAS